MGSRWPYSCCFVGCYSQNLFNIFRNILVQLPSSFSSIHLVSSMDTTVAWKKLHFISSDRSDLHMTDSQSIAVHAFAGLVSMLFSVDETLLPR